MLLPPALGSSPHPPVSVYGTGLYGTIAAFPDSRLSHFPTCVRSASRLCLAVGLFLHNGSCACTGFLTPGMGFAFCVTTVLSVRGTGISTSCPSATLLSLALGPDLPRADQLYPGNLGYSAGRILTFLSLLIPAFSLPSSPRHLPVPLRPPGNAPLPNILTYASWASVVCFSPGHFRRRTSRLVSYYALFECVAASEPTS